MKKLLLPSLLSAVVVFIWMFISWALMPWHASQFHNLPGGDSLSVLLKQNVKEPGLYRYPGVPTEKNEKALKVLEKKYADGPIIHFMVYDPNGMGLMNPMEFLWGFIINFLSALIAAFLLANSTFKKKGFFARVGFVMLVAAFAALIGPFIDWNWLYFPAGYSIGVAFDYVATWFFGGLILAWKIKEEVPVTAKPGPTSSLN